MINQILALTWKDLKLFFRDGKALTLIFLQPFLFIVVMTYALAGIYGSGGKPIQILAVNEDSGKEAAKVIKDLASMKGFSVESEWKGVPLSRRKAEDLITAGKRTLAVIFPGEFSSTLEQLPTGVDGPTTSVLLMADPAASSTVTDPILGMLQGLVERATFAAVMPKGIDYFFDQYHLDEGKINRKDFKERAERSLSGGLEGSGNRGVIIEKVAPPAMKVKKFPSATQQNVPGYTVYGVFWIATLLSASVLREKREGTFQRLMAAPLSRTAMLAGKLIPYYLINLIQIAVMMGASALLFRMSLGQSIGGLVAVSLVLATTATGLGIFISAFARTEAQATSLTVLLLLTLSSLGGCFVPRFIMPSTLKAIGLITPHAWALDAYQDLIVRGYGLIEVLPKIGVLAGFSLLLFIAAVSRFRFE